MARVDFWTEPDVCLDENLSTDDAGLIVIRPEAVPRIVRDLKFTSDDGPGTVFPNEILPGRQLISGSVGWRNETLLPVMIRLIVTRASKRWVTSNPNFIEFRDRWTYVITPDDVMPDDPNPGDIYMSKSGSGIDCGTNSVAEPNPGKHWVWIDANMDEDWIGPVDPGDKINLRYAEYVWTPPPFSDNANKNKPEHRAFAGWTRITMWAFPSQGTLVTG